MHVFDELTNIFGSRINVCVCKAKFTIIILEYCSQTQLVSTHQTIVPLSIALKQDFATHTATPCCLLTGANSGKRNNHSLTARNVTECRL